MKMLTVFIYLFISLAVISLSNAISYDQIQWKLASTSKPNHYDTCNYYSLVPYTPSVNDFIWNSTVLQYVVETALGENILPGSYKGLMGCCSSSLWCIPGEGCFTQNFGGSFVNFGWTRNNSLNVPVYSCVNSATTLGNLNFISAFADEIQTNSPVLAIGNGATENSASFLSQINGYYCPYGDICQTFRCSNDYDCPLGMGCFNVSGYPINSCHQFCANANDTSCPCGQSCVPSEGPSTSAMYVCASDDLQGNMPFTNTLATCAPLGGLLSDFSVAQSASFSFASDLQGATATAMSLSVLSCTKDSTCIDYNPCTRDTCQLGKCVHEPFDSQCQSNSPTILEQTAPYTYLTSVTSSSNTATTLVPSFASLYSSLGFAGRTKYTGDRVVIMGFTWTYFGNILTNFMVDVFGVLSFAPYIGCDDADQCLYFTSSTNSISVGYDTNRNTSSAYKAYAVQWSDENSDGKNDAVHVFFLAPSTASAAEMKPSTIVSIYQDGSVRMTYNTTVAINTDSSLSLLHQVTGGSSASDMEMLPFTGLWGAHAGRNYLYPGNASDPTLSANQYTFTTSSTSRYHIANASFVLAAGTAGSTAPHVQAVAFCPFAVSVCAPTSCVSSGDELKLRWNGTNSCFASVDRAISSDNLTLSCSWLGGLYVTAASYDSVLVDGYRAVTCSVPNIDSTLLAQYANINTNNNSNSNNNNTNLAAGVLLSVNILPFLPGASDALDKEVAADGEKAVRAMYYDPSSGELARGSLLVRYYPSAGDVPSVCGCRPFTSSVSSASLDDDSLTCASDSNICGGQALYGTSASTSRRRRMDVKTAAEAATEASLTMNVDDNIAYYEIIQTEEDVLLFTARQHPAYFSKKTHTHKRSAVNILSAHDEDDRTVSVTPSSLSSSSSSSFSPIASFVAKIKDLLSPTVSFSSPHLQSTSIDTAAAADPAAVIAPTTESTLSLTTAISLSSTASSVAFGAKKYIFDCADVAFGSAYVDACGLCSGGVTRRTPVSPVGEANGLCLQAGSSGDGESGTLTIITQTIILLMVICCLTFLTSAVTFSIRRMLLRRQTEQFLVENELALQQMMMNADLTGRTPSGRMRALTDFEREALGEVVFTQAFAQSLAKASPPDNSNNINNNNNNGHTSLKNVPSAASVAQPPLECSICLVEFVEGDILRHLPDPCGHVFHRDCVDHWFHQSNQCPLCKRSMRAILAGTYDEQEHHRLQQSSSGIDNHNNITGRSRPVSTATAMSPTTAMNNNNNNNSSSGFMVVQGHDVEDIDVALASAGGATSTSTSRPTSRTHRHRHHHPHHSNNINNINNNNINNYPEDYANTYASYPNNNNNNNNNHPHHHHQHMVYPSTAYVQTPSSSYVPYYEPQQQQQQQQPAQAYPDYDYDRNDDNNNYNNNNNNNMEENNGRAILSPEERLRVEAMRLEQRRQEEMSRYYAQNNVNSSYNINNINNNNNNNNSNNNGSIASSRRYEL